MLLILVFPEGAGGDEVGGFDHGRLAGEPEQVAELGAHLACGIFVTHGIVEEADRTGFHESSIRRILYKLEDRLDALQAGGPGPSDPACVSLGMQGV